MDLTYDRFSANVVKVIQDIADAHFIAFDLEFSGISRPSQRLLGKPTLQEHYEETIVAARKYQVLQFGLCVVKEDLVNGQYIVKPYNFNISPLPTLRERHFRRDWAMNSGAVSFLLKNKFDFGLPLLTGIPYLSRVEEIQARIAMSGEEEKKRPNMILKVEDENLIKHVHQSIATWQSQPEESRDLYLNIPTDDRGKGVPGVLNRYQSRLVHQIVQNEYPHIRSVGMGHFVQLTAPSKKERDEMEKAHQQSINREIGRAVGFRWILEAMVGKEISAMSDDYFLAAVSQFKEPREGLTRLQTFVADLNQELAQRRKVLIGHNCFTDLIFLHQFFLGELPDRIEDFRDNINEYFPAIVDTKYIASFGPGRGKDTTLAVVEEELRTESEPSIVIPAEFDRYASDEKQHEAGYDALLTAKIAIKLSAKMERESTYYDQDTPKATRFEISTSSEPFGIGEEGYVTASEDITSQQSDTSVSVDDEPRSPELSAEDKTQAGGISNTATLVVDPTSTEHESQSFAYNMSEVVAVKDKRLKPKPVNWSSTAEVEKVRSAFAVANIYDVLNDKMDSSDNDTEDIISLSNPSSPSRTKGLLDTETMIKKGRLMPRWDGGNEFWKLFGNKLQVNSAKEGVYDLSA